jgi:FlaA1/EpsC-like NDP-sugar epimerase
VIRLPDVPPSFEDDDTIEDPDEHRTFPERVATILRREVPLIMLDLGIVVVSYLAILVLRFDGNVPTRYWQAFWGFVPIVMVIHFLANYLFELYGQMWRYASVQEARRVLLAAVFAGVTVSVLSGIVGELRPLPLSVVALGAILAFLGFGAIRFQSRFFALRRGAADIERRRVVVVGAGYAGIAVVRDLLRNPAFGLDPVGLVDDDPKKIGLSIHGVQVIGRTWEIPRLVPAHRVDQVLLAIPSAKSGLVRDVAAGCEKVGVVMRVLPSMSETMAGRVTARDIRDLKIEDLLGRQQVHTDLDAVAAILRGQRVLVTGAGGSIGSEIVRQVLAFDPERVIILDHDETHLHDLYTELDGDPRVKSLLADVRDQHKILAAVMEYSPDVIFHAAAHKHVPVLEDFPEEALFTNIIGTANLADAAAAAHVSQFVLISTDKAVKPSSVMGASKWFSEQSIWCASGNGTKFSAVRFGNVLGSRGSVIPTFFRQIEQGGPVTVTDPTMTRYFMSVQEAVQLVLQAAALSKGGEVFTLDMGDPVNIHDLARELIRLSGRVPGKDIEIKIVGRRPGEKLYEDLVNSDEEQVPSGHPSIVAARPPLPHRGTLRQWIRSLEELAREGRLDELRAAIKIYAQETPRAVPETITL